VSSAQPTHALEQRRTLDSVCIQTNVLKEANATVQRNRCTVYTKRHYTEWTLYGGTNRSITSWFRNGAVAKYYVPGPYLLKYTHSYRKNLRSLKIAFIN